MTLRPGLTVKEVTSKDLKPGDRSAQTFIDVFKGHVDGGWLIQCDDNKVPELIAGTTLHLSDELDQALRDGIAFASTASDCLNEVLPTPHSGEPEEVRWYVKSFFNQNLSTIWLYVFCISSGSEAGISDALGRLLNFVVSAFDLCEAPVSDPGALPTVSCRSPSYEPGDTGIIHNTMLEEISTITRTGGWQYDPKTGNIRWSEQTYRLFGLSTCGGVGVSRSLASFPVESRRQIHQMISKVCLDHQPCTLELYYFTHRGKQRWARFTARFFRFSDTELVMGTITDISEQRRLSDTEHNFTLYLRTILDNLNDAVLTLDSLGTIITANNAVLSVFGHHKDTVIGGDIGHLLPEVFCCDDIEVTIRELLQTQSSHQEYYGLHADTSQFAVEISVSEITQDGYQQFVLIIKDITERKKASDNMFRLAFYDSVTHIPNSASFEKALRQLIEEAQSYNQDIFCVMLDIDKFSQLNLMFGKETGDYVLRTLADRICNKVGHLFEVFRGQGDRFFVLYHTSFDSQSQAIEEMLNEAEWELQHSVLTDIELNGRSQPITAAISSALIEGSKASYEKVVGILEFGRNRAKEQGLSGKVTFDRRAFSDYERHNYISQAFAQALQSDEFHLVLQPQFDRQQRIVCSEALLRWNQPHLGTISPAEFIPIAEQSDAIVDIGYWVINRACEILAMCNQQKLITRIAVNISGRHIVHPDFAEQLLNITQRWQVSPSQLQLEITETTLVASITIVRERIEMLSGIGFSFSVDDFGTGYSSLSYLKELPISELKIDRYFVDEINFAHQDVPIVNTILDMAEAMNVRTVAEGIENEIQLQYLQARNCQTYQGFYLARPMVQDEWFGLIKKQN